MENSANIGVVSAAAGGRAGERAAALLEGRRLVAFALAAALFTLAAGQITDPDFWWHLRTGQLIYETRAVPAVDPFSFTAGGREWVAHEWLTELAMYGVYRLAGWAGLIVAFALMMTAALMIVYGRAARAAQSAGAAAAAVLLAALACAPMWGVRPQMVSFLLASVFVWLLDDYARDGRARRLLWLPPLMLLWANAHGAFALGLALVGLTAAGVVLDETLGGRFEWARAWGRVRPLAAALAGCACVVPLNPNGARLFTYPLETLASGAMMRYIDEWRSPDFHRPEAHAFALLLGATFAALALSPRRLRPRELLVLGVTAYAALRSWRNIPVFALVAAPLVAEHAWCYFNSLGWRQKLTASAEKRAEKRRHGEAGGGLLKTLMNGVLFVVVPAGLCAAGASRAAARQESVEAERYPAAAVEFLRGHKEGGPIFNAYGWGGYLIWKLYPNRPVYIDGRADVYGDALVEDFLRTEGGERGWRERLERDGVRAVMVVPDAPLASLLREDTGWQKVFEDTQAVVFFKR